MKVIILAGGTGTRLRSIVADVPKPMAPVGGKPFLEYIILALAAQGLNEIILSVGYKNNIIQSHFEDGARWGANILYSKEDAPLGTGGAIREALKVADEPHCLILNGDTFNQLNFLEMEDHHLSKKCLMTVGLKQKKNASRYGTVRINDTHEIVDFYEKSQVGTGYVSCGAYIMDKAILDRMPSGYFSLENELFPDMIGAGICGFVSRGFFIDIGIPSAYSYINDNCYLLTQSNSGETIHDTIRVQRARESIEADDCGKKRAQEDSP